jgi:hypothetical protein
MAGFFKKIFSGAKEKRPDHQPRQRDGVSVVDESLEVAKLAGIFRYFPLGEKVKYYPEYQKEGALETIVLGYGVNDQFVYSSVNVHSGRDGQRDALVINAGGQEQLVQKVESFCFLIPFNRDDENKRDYARRAELGPRGAFRRRNTITLMSCTRGGTLGYLDTVVRKILPLKSGIYAGHEVVLLDIIPSSMQLTDQRQHYRLQTYLPAKLAIKDGGTFSCILMDFSEESVQLRFAETNKELDALTEFRHITLTVNINVGNHGKEFVLDGVMFRKTGASLVMNLQGIYKDGKLEPIGLVDLLDIKASLLKHPSTEQVLQRS